MVTLNAREPSRRKSVSRDAEGTVGRYSGSYALQVRVARQVHINTDTGPGVNIDSQWQQVMNLPSFDLMMRSFSAAWDGSRRQTRSAL